jgi:hypothetical protein
LSHFNTTTTQTKQLTSKPEPAIETRVPTRLKLSTWSLWWRESRAIIDGLPDTRKTTKDRRWCKLDGWVFV